MNELFYAIFGKTYDDWSFQFGDAAAIVGMESIIYLLENMGINVDDGYSFSWREDWFIPYSMSVHIGALQCKNVPIDSTIKFSEPCTKAVETIRKMIDARPEGFRRDFWLTTIICYHFLRNVRRMTPKKIRETLNEHYYQLSLLGADSLDMEYIKKAEKVAKKYIKVV